MAKTVSGSQNPLSSSLTYTWSVSDYIKSVENSSHPLIKNYEQAEIDYISSIPALPKKTLIDVGAGYGRVLPHIAPPRTRNVIAVEINDSMFSELQKRAALYPNTIALKGNANDLSNILEGTDIVSPVIVCLQNSIGTWEGDYRKAIEEMGKVAREKQGEVIISAWRAEQFRDYAIDIYTALSPVVGTPDESQIDFENGIFRSKTGYVSKWWRPEERKEMEKLLGGRRVNEILGTPFFILHVAYN